MNSEAIIILNAADDVSRTGGAVFTGQKVNMSFQSYCTVLDGSGTVKIQASNDNSSNKGSLSNQFTPTNWVDVPNATGTVTSGSATLITLSNVSYNYVRAVYTSSGAGTGNIVVQMCAMGA